MSQAYPSFQMRWLALRCVCGGVRRLLPREGREKDVAKWKQVHLKCSSPLPAQGVLHKGAQLTNGVKFNEGN